MKSKFNFPECRVGLAIDKCVNFEFTSERNEGEYRHTPNIQMYMIERQTKNLQPKSEVDAFTVF